MGKLDHYVTVADIIISQKSSIYPLPTLQKVIINQPIPYINVNVNFVGEVSSWAHFKDNFTLI